MQSDQFKSYFQFTSAQRSGIGLLLFFIIFFQLLYFFVATNSVLPTSKEEQKWLSLQTQIDSLKKEKRNFVSKVYPYNPNFITDYKGYKLGMSVKELDRLFVFRKSNKYVNSAREFQDVTQVSDSLLAILSPNFKFPDWVLNKKEHKVYAKTNFPIKEKKVVLELNQATKEDFIRVYGIGEGLSDRILKEKEKLGGFVSMKQLNDIWGLSPEVIEKLGEQFEISHIPSVNKININNSNIKELMQFPYFKYALAKSIVTFRSMNGKISSVEDLTQIKGFPIDKVDIIVLYLEF
jgi:DNA uptake protein ComE-like DNA-binding protein